MDDHLTMSQKPECLNPGGGTVTMEQIADIIHRLWNCSCVDVNAILSPRGIARPTASGMTLIDNIAPRIARILADLQAENTGEVGDVMALCTAIVYSYHAHVAATGAKDILDKFVSGKPAIQEKERQKSAETMKALVTAVVSAFFTTMLVGPIACIGILHASTLVFIVVAVMLGTGVITFELAGCAQQHIRRQQKNTHKEHANKLLRVSRRYMERVLTALRKLSSHTRDKFPQSLKDDIMEKFNGPIELAPGEALPVATVVDFALDDDSCAVATIQRRWYRGED
jgi:hypothetical protein